MVKKKGKFGLNKKKGSMGAMINEMLEAKKAGKAREKKMFGKKGKKK